MLFFFVFYYLLLWIISVNHRMNLWTTNMASSFIYSSPGDIKASEYRIGHGVLVDMCPSLWARDQSWSPVIGHQRTQKSLGLVKGAHTNAAVDLWWHFCFSPICFYPLSLLKMQNHVYFDILASVIWEIRWSLPDSTYWPIKARVFNHLDATDPHPIPNI